MSNENRKLTRNKIGRKKVKRLKKGQKIHVSSESPVARLLNLRHPIFGVALLSQVKTKLYNLFTKFV